MNSDLLRRLRLRAHVHVGTGGGEPQPHGSCYGSYEPCGEHHVHDDRCGGRSLICGQREDRDLVAFLAEYDLLVATASPTLGSLALGWILRKHNIHGACPNCCDDELFAILDLVKKGAPQDDNWTVDPETGRSNSSKLFLKLSARVAEIIKSSAHSLLAGHAESVARTILAQLAHVHGLGPRIASASAVASAMREADAEPRGGTRGGLQGEPGSGP